MTRPIPKSLLPRMFRLLCLTITTSSLTGDANVNVRCKPEPLEHFQHQGPGTNKPSPGAEIQLERDRELREIIDRANGVPPEFGADVLAQVVESGKIREVNLRVKLLETAFELAASSQQPIRRNSLPGSLRDTRSGFFASAFSLGLDRMSLQARIASDMVPLEKEKSRELFSQIQFPTLIPLHCEEPLVYDPAPFYQALGQISHDAFTLSERKDERHVVFLEKYVVDIQSHSQIVPIIEMLVSANLSGPQLQGLVSRFVSGMERLTGDEQSFSAAASGPGGYPLTASMVKLVAALEVKSLPTAGVLAAFRVYLVSNFNGRVCPAAMMQRRDKSSVPAAVHHFNEEFQERLQSSQIPRINEQDLDSAQIGKDPVVSPLWQSPQSKSLLNGIKKLRFGTKMEALTEGERKTVEWSAELHDFLTQLESWKPEDEPEADYFHEKSILYEGLVELVPDRGTRLNVLDNFVRFMSQNRFQSTNRIEWFSHCYALLARNPKPDERAEVINTYRSSNDQTLRLFGQVEDWKSK